RSTSCRTPTSRGTCCRCRAPRPTRPGSAASPSRSRRSRRGSRAESGDAEPRYGRNRRRLMYKFKPVPYNGTMRKVDVSTARADLARVVEESRKEPVLIERYGKPAGVLISPERHEELLAALEE